jgi:hypothetical protein
VPNIIIANLLFSLIPRFLLIKNICSTGMQSGVTIFSKTGFATEVLFSSLDFGKNGEILILIP